jgi:hypothetical protein
VEALHTLESGGYGISQSTEFEVRRLIDQVRAQTGLTTRTILGNVFVAWRDMLVLKEGETGFSRQPGITRRGSGIPLPKVRRENFGRT